MDQNRWRRHDRHTNFYLFSTLNNRIEYKERHVKYGRIKGDRMKHDSDVNRFSEHAATHIQ